MKKVLFLIAIFCSVLMGAMAQYQDATISASRVKYWIGTGNSTAILMVNWCNPDTALAWGYRFDGDSVLVSTMLTDIITADSRLGFTGSSSWLTDLYYTEGTDTFHIAPDYVVYNVSGGYADVADAQYFHSGDYIKFGGYSCSLPGDSVWIEDPYYGNYWMHASVWNTTVTPVEIPGVPAEDATIDASAIQYWVGTGSNQAIFIIDWCSASTALAWGYRFDGESVLVSTMLTDIANADPRLTFAGTPSWLTDLVFSTGDQVYSILPDYVVYNVNGGYADVADAQNVYAGDYVKFGGYTCAQMGESIWIEDPTYGDYWMYASVWNTPVTAVTPPTGVADYEQTTLSVCPNPCTGSVRIQTEANEAVVLYNLQGAEVMRTVAVDNITTLDVNELPAGVYFVKSGARTAKIVKR